MGRRVRFITGYALANELIEARGEKEHGRLLGRYARVELLIVDELGYLPFSKAGARLKAGMRQSELAETLGIRQNMVSDYERGKRSYSAAMAKRLSKVLKMKEESIRYRKK